MIEMGTKVQHSAYSLQRLRDNSMGGFSQRMRDVARREYERRKVCEGVVTAVQDRGAGMMPVVSVAWNDGSVSESFADMVEAVQP